MGPKKKKTPKSKENSSENERQPGDLQTGEIEEEGQLVEDEQNEGEEPEEALSEIDKLAREKDDYYDRLLRTQADFDNYRKRVQKERANLLRYGAESSLREILPVVDNIARAVDSARAHEDSNSQLREGIELILTQFLGILEKLGVKPIETIGHPFDPNKHDGLLRVHAPDAEEGAVVDEIRKGYYLHDKVLRPAQVTVGTHEPVQEPG